MYNMHASRTESQLSFATKSLGSGPSNWEQYILYCASFTLSLIHLEGGVGRKGGRECGGREEGREGVWGKGGREGGSVGEGREGGRECGGREGGREGLIETGRGV